jgi:serine/threonine protein kinase
MFPWARLGNLREFWDQDKTNSSCRILTPRFLEWALTQLSGLAEAVKSLHSVPGTNDSWRHGDLKPENILCFESIGTLSPDLYLPCILVIADVGLTSHHTTATQERQNETRAKSSTIMYEPPETELDRNQKKGRSRRFDIWSMGCIYFEFIIWLLYGSVELDRFIMDLGDNKRFYESDSTKKPKLHHVVETWAEHIRNDRRCPPDTALRWLLDLVIDKLLCTDMGTIPTVKRADTMLLHRTSTMNEANGDIPKSPTVLVRAPTVQSLSRSSTGAPIRGRASAEEMDDEMKEIYRRATTNDGMKIDWMKFDVPVQMGPTSQYRRKLSESDALRPMSTTSRDREVRKKYSGLPTLNES